MNIYLRNSMVIHKTVNGFIVNVKGTREEQEDGLDGVHVFNTSEALSNFLYTYFAEVGNPPFPPGGKPMPCPSDWEWI